MLFEYAFDRRSPFSETANRILIRAFSPPNVVLSSLFLRGELLVIPTRRQDEFSIARIAQVLAPDRVITGSFDERALATFINLRAHDRVKSVDAIHLACAARASADFFVTNDHKLLKLTVPGIGKIVGLDEALQVL
jgi:predicted nucleic acid-binding protein